MVMGEAMDANTQPNTPNVVVVEDTIPQDDWSEVQGGIRILEDGMPTVVLPEGVPPPAFFVEKERLLDGWMFISEKGAKWEGDPVPGA
jgi:hypothetical protein